MVFSYFFDDTHELVPEHVTFLHRRNIAILKVEVRAADRRARDPQDGVMRVTKDWVLNVLDPDVMLSIPTSCFHGVLLTASSRRLRNTR
jgi:hypothetical protein